MTPFYFGPDDRLFGIYTEPRRRSTDAKAVLICSPLGQEYLRTHRALVRLAQELGARGTHVLRFDYRGCGDSLGRFDAYSPDDWLEDISCAFDEMLAGTGASETAIVGLRIGALLATIYAQTGPRADRFVLWEPVLDGVHFVQELRSSHREYLDGMWVDPAAVRDEAQSLGFHYPAQLRTGLQQLQLGSKARCGSGARHVLCVSQNLNMGLMAPSQFNECSLEHQAAPNLGFWERRDAGHEKGLIPIDAIATIARWIAP